MNMADWLTFRVIWLTILLAASSCTLVVLGVVAADWRAQHAEQEYRTELLRQASEVASSINPYHVTALAFDETDVQRHVNEVISEQFRAFSHETPLAVSIYGLAVRDDTLVYGPSFVRSGVPTPSPGAKYAGSSESLVTSLASGRRLVESPLPPFVSAMAPVFDPNTSDVLMTVVLNIPVSDWQERLLQVRLELYAVVLLLLTFQFLGVGAAYLRSSLIPNRMRHLETVLVALFFFLLTVVITYFVAESELRGQRLAFMRAAESHAQGVESSLRTVQQELGRISTYIGTSAPLTEDAFATYARTLVDKMSVDVCFWAPYVPEEQHDQLLEQARAAGRATYQVYVFEEDGSQRVVETNEGPFYPVYYIAPPTDEQFTPGFDMGSIAEDRAAMEAAVRTGHATAVVPRSAPEEGVRVYVPVYENNIPGARRLRGFVGITLRFDLLLQYAPTTAIQQHAHVSTRLFQVLANEDPLLLGSYSDDGHDAAAPPMSFAGIGDNNDLMMMHAMFVLAHTYALLVEPTPGFFVAYNLRNTYAVALFAIFLTIALTIFVGILRNQQTAMESKIWESTIELRERSETFRRLFNESTDPILLLEKGKIVDCNNSTLRLLKYNAKQKLINRRPENISPPMQPDGRPSPYAFREMVALCVRNGHHAFEWTHLKSDGTPVPVETMFTLITVRGVNHIHVTWRDITERKLAEEALRESEEKYRSLVDRLPIGLYRSTPAPEDGFVMVNNAMVEIYGAKNAAELMARDLSELYVNPADRTKLWRELEKTGSLTGYEVQHRRNDDTVIWCSISGSIVRDKDGEIEYFDGSVMDITERKTAAEERMEMERRLLHLQKLESLGILAGGIAHDFNNLLAAVLGNLEIAAGEIDETSDEYDCILKAVAAARRAAALTDQMLAYSGKGTLLVKPLNLNAAIESNVSILQTSVAKKATLTLQLGEDLPPIYADSGQIQQIVVNLVTNAAEAMGDGEGAISVKTGKAEYTAEELQRSQIEKKPEPGEFVFLEISDTGCGMEPETLRRVFDPFFSTKFTGRGLGMSAVLGIVKGHQGALMIDSSVGRGTVIKVLFPKAEPLEELPVAEVYEPELPKSAPSTELDTWSGTFLVVDDEEPLRELGQKVLSRFGFDTIVARDGQEAVEIFEQRADEIVAVLLDLTMPRMDGAAAFEAMRKIKPDVKVILCSGFSESQALQHFPGKKLAGYVHKPYGIRTLRAEIEKIMKKEDSGQSPV